MKVRKNWKLLQLTYVKNRSSNSGFSVFRKRSAIMQLIWFESAFAYSWDSFWHPITRPESIALYPMIFWHQVKCSSSKDSKECFHHCKVHAHSWLAIGFSRSLLKIPKLRIASVSTLSILRGMVKLRLPVQNAMWWQKENGTLSTIILSLIKIRWTSTQLPILPMRIMTPPARSTIKNSSTFLTMRLFGQLL